MEEEMKKYRVQVIAKTLETYEIEAANEAEAEELWAEGKLVATNDNLETEIMEVVSVGEV
jgi:hypothetical protein